MDYYYNKDDYIGRYGWDTHNHKQEAEDIAKAVFHNELENIINQEIEEKVTKIWNSAVSQLVHAITYDVNTCIQIAFENAHDIFNSSKTQKFISDSVVNALIKDIKSINPIIIK